MTKLEIAFIEASKLPPKEQEALATWILGEIESEKRWTGMYASSEDLLVKLADEAVQEYLTGKARPLDPNTL